MEAPSTATPPKARSFSDPPSAAPASLQPSPTFCARARRTSKDDQAVPTTPSSSSSAAPASRPPPSAASPLRPRRPDFLGLSLQMAPPPAAGSPLSVQWVGPPLSPQLDERDIYVQSQSLSASPATSLPRHSRGMDFSRASSTLHHSTLAESSPDSSPVISQRSMAVPARKLSVSSVMLLDSPHMAPTWPPPERSTISSSLGSVNMLASDSDSSDSAGDGDASMAGDEGDDVMLTTPHVHKLHNPSLPTPLPAHVSHTPGGPGSAAALWGATATFSPAQASLMKAIRRPRLHTKQSRRSRKSSSSASNSGYSSMASPRTTSPPPLRSIETAAGTGNPSAAVAGYFAWASAARSRRESLALGTDGLHLSSGNDSGDEASANDRTAPATPGVVRRPVTRRGNLLPKTKGFARIRAQLMEEAAPVDTEMRRERDTIQQVRERDNSVATEQQLDLAARHGTAAGTAPSSPTFLAAVPESAQEDFFGPPELGSGDATPSAGRGLGMLNFAAHASRHSGGRDYWARFDSASGNRHSTPPPPPPTFTRHASSVVSDTSMDSPAGNTPNHGNTNSGGGSDAYSAWRRPRARSSASEASEALFGGNATTLGGNHSSNSGSGMNDDVAIKKFKRRREDDFDIATIKRRAVSPGMMGSGSAQNSPVLTQSSPSTAGLWGLPPPSASSERKEKLIGESSGSHIIGSAIRSNNGGPAGHGAVVGPQGKKLGLQGMVDTNDGLMKMSIE